jgi:hypothetical protein
MKTIDKEEVFSTYRINGKIYSITISQHISPNDWVVIVDRDGKKGIAIVKTVDGQFNYIENKEGWSWSVSKHGSIQSVSVELLRGKRWIQYQCCSPILKIIKTNDKKIKELVKKTILTSAEYKRRQHNADKELSEQHERNRKFDKYLSHQMRWNPAFWR